jgi:hypothetical protein
MFRCTPVCLYLCGKPKIGKSHLVIRLCNYFNQKLFNVNNHTFCITTTTEHWDGYSHQPIVVFDDHYKLNDCKQIIDASAIFRVVSCTMFQPPFANINLKGLTFDSKIIIVTSNVGYPSTVFLPLALHRRHKHHVIMVPNGKPMDNDFNHVNFYYTCEIIDPFAGMYQYPFSRDHDIPFSIDEFNLLPFKKFYSLIFVQALCDIIINDYNRENHFFQDFLSICDNGDVLINNHGNIKS